MIARWLPPNFITFSKVAVLALSSMGYKRMVGSQSLGPSVITAANEDISLVWFHYNIFIFFLMHLCSLLKPLSCTHVSLLLHRRCYKPQQISIGGKFYLLFPWTLSPPCFPLLHFPSRHPFSRALFSSAQVLLWCWTVFTERRHPEWQSNKSWESNSEMTRRELERGCTSFLPSFLQPCHIFVSPLFSPHLVKTSHPGRFMELIKVKDWALHTASEVHFILIFNSCSFHIGDLLRRLSNNRFFLISISFPVTNICTVSSVLCRTYPSFNARHNQ